MNKKGKYVHKIKNKVMKERKIRTREYEQERKIRTQD